MATQEQELAAVLYSDDPRQAFERLDDKNFFPNDTSFFAHDRDVCFRAMKAVYDSGGVPDLVNTGQYFVDEGTPDLITKLVGLKTAAEEEAEATRAALNQPETSTEEPRAKKFDLVPIGELIVDLQPTEWLVRPFLEANSFSILFGEPGSCKSFLAIAWGLCIATGTPWLGHEVKQGPVIAIIGEGHNGFGKRAAAWSKAMNINIERAPFFVSTAPAALTEVESAIEVGKKINELASIHGKPELILIDTLARNFGPGDENSTLDMNQFIANLDLLIGRDFTRLLIHHTGHGDKSRARGSSALKGAADAEYKLARQGELVSLSCEKMKDSEKFDSVTLRPILVNLGGPLNDPISSLHLEKSTPPEKTVTLSPQMRQALSLLEQNTKKNCLNTLSDFRDICVREKVYTRSAFYNAVKTMEEKKLINISDGYVSLS